MPPPPQAVQQGPPGGQGGVRAGPQAGWEPRKPRTCEAEGESQTRGVLLC